MPIKIRPPLSTFIYRASGLSFLTGYAAGAILAIFTRDVMINVSRYGSYLAVRSAVAGAGICWCISMSSMVWAYITAK